MDKNQILEQLKQINYPGFNRDVVSFGMVKEVVIDKNIVTIILAISSSNKEKKNIKIKLFYTSLLKNLPNNILKQLKKILEMILYIFINYLMF